MKRNCAAPFCFYTGNPFGCHRLEGRGDILEFKARVGCGSDAVPMVATHKCHHREVFQPDKYAPFYWKFLLVITCNSQLWLTRSVGTERQMSCGRPL